MSAGTDRSTDRSTGRSALRAVVLAGWAAKGVVYLALAWLVLQLALGSASEQASTTGALQYIAQQPAGRTALVVLGVGLLAYAAGRLLEVTVLARGEVDGKDKVLGVLLSLVYLGLAASAFTVVSSAGSSGSGGGSAEKQGSSLLLGLPGGQLLVAAAGSALIAVGLYSAWQGLQKAFLPTLRSSEMPDGLRRATRWIGTTAYVTKGAIFVLLGGFLVQAAVTYDPDKAEGLDGALRDVAGRSWGPAVLVAVAVGLGAYALFALIEAKYRRVGVSATGVVS